MRNKNAKKSSSGERSLNNAFLSHNAELGRALHCHLQHRRENNGPLRKQRVGGSRTGTPAIAMNCASIQN
eukprot:1764804-Lingulodinium_polyedra.AAC.1